MSRKILNLIIFAVIVLAFPAMSDATTLPLFGPKKYERTTGKSDVFSDTIEACNTGASYVLVVENGDAGANRVSSGAVLLNGVEVIKQNEFSQKVGRIEKAVSLNNENIVAITLASAPGSFIKVSLICTANCLDVKISSPADQATVNKSTAIIKGNIYNALGEAGVTIKAAGQQGEVLSLAQKNGSAFAGLAALQDGLNMITAIVSDVCGQKAVDVARVNTTVVPEPLRLSVRPVSGVLSATGSFRADFEADASLTTPVASYSWDFNGDGVAESTGKDMSKATADYSSTGLYFPQVTVTDMAGKAYSEMTVVNIQSREEVDALLKSKWTAITGELVAGNVKSALRHISERSQDMYKYNFELMKSHLPEIANDMGQITLVNIIGDTAEYDLTATQNGKTTSFFVQFVRDSDGIWRLKFY